MSKFFLPFLLGLAILPLPAQTQAKNSTSQTTPRQAGEARSSIGGTKAHRSREVSDLLRATSEARVAVEDRDKDDALFHINHALDNANRLVSANARFIPLYEELDRYSVVGPIVAQRKTGNASPNAVRDVQGTFTSASFDMQQAKDHLTAAKQAVEQGEYRKASAALAAVQDGVVVTSIKADLPLLQARENLILARESADQGDFTEAHAALQAASNALVTYETGGGRHAAEAKTLHGQIDTYNQAIQQNHSDAVSKIDSWWEQMSDWAAEPRRG